MPDYSPSNLASFRLYQAKECLQSAEREFAANSFKTVANRSYYCIFHTMRAILALDRFDSRKHSGVIAAFRQRYIKTGIFSAKYSDIVGNAFEVRNESDYEDFYVVSKHDVEAQLENAKVFLAAVEEYITTKLQTTLNETGDSCS